jgi:UTP--glucose-1-phosphate uridylyltransferase
MMKQIDAFDENTKAVLGKNGFETIPFDKLTAALRENGIDENQNLIKGPAAPLSDDKIDRLPRNDREKLRITALGKQAVEAGQVAVVVLNGGMATRFGSRAKGIAEAVDGRSFLDLKLTQADIASSGKAEILLMNSFATEAATQKHLKTLSISSQIRQFNQMVSIRVTPRGDIFLTKAGTPSLHAPGHGDLLYALTQSGELKRFMDRGGKYITVSNVDNLAAGLDPLIIGMHIDKKRPMTVEIVPIHPGDTGGFPAVVDGRPILVEAFRVPKSFDFMQVKRFNTNSFVFDAAAFLTEAELSWYPVLKTVEDKKAVQFERLIGQLTEFIDVTWLEVGRDGAEGRFIPIKTPQDLIKEENNLRSLLSRQGVL